MLRQKKGRRSTLVLVVRDESKASAICTHGLLADTFVARLFGLLGQKGLAKGSGLLIRPSSGVHTFGMSFVIDIVSLDKRGCVVGVFELVGPGTIRGLNWKTSCVLELPAGRIRECGIQAGDELTMTLESPPEDDSLLCPEGGNKRAAWNVHRQVP